MRATCLLFALCFVLVAGAQENGSRIIGGSPTTIGQYPFSAALLSAPLAFTQSCGGNIINNRAILTAGHCLFGYYPSQWRIRVGSSYANSGGVVHNVNRIIIHPQYTHWMFENDIAILHSSTLFVYNNNVRAVSIPGPNYNLADNQAVWTIGWGTTSDNGLSSEELRHVQLWIVNQGICRSNYNDIAISISDSLICAGWLEVGGRDSCQGDNGGPLLHNNVIVGIVTWRNQCASSRYPGLFVRVNRYTSWIQSNA